MTETNEVKVLFAVNSRQYPDLSLIHDEAERVQQRESVRLQVSTVSDGDEEALAEAIRQADVFVAPRISGRLLEAGQRLKLVQIPFAGVNQQDMSVFRGQRRVWLANSHAPTTSTAEHAWALVLALAKQLVWCDRELRQGVWRGMRTSSPSIELRGRKLAVVGLGSIGQEVARLGRAFGMKVYATKRRVSEQDREALRREVDFLGSNDDLAQVLKECDFAVLCVPLTPETTGLIGAEELELLRGKYLVNVARGPVVDEEALFNALRDGVLAGAGIDTWYNYPTTSAGSQNTRPGRFPFEDLPNVVMSPHNAGYTDSMLAGGVRVALSNAARIARGEVPENLVDIELGY